MRKILALAVVIMIILTACKMYDRKNWRYQYSGQEKRELTPELLDILKDPNQKINRDETE